MALNSPLIKKVIETISYSTFYYVNFIHVASAPPTKRVKLIGQSVSKDWSLGASGKTTMMFDLVQFTFISSDIDEMIFMLSDAPVRSHDPIVLTAVYSVIG